MHVSRFDNGGFVIHRITLFGYAGRFSAWFDADGNLLDCEQMTRGFPNGRKAPDGARIGLAALGRIYRQAAA